ncbi:class I SAM-dependent methyltransferase [Portibacter lacus]|uniref:Methyltransferase n=1 Tax=Portibacter lacus TaxID=1099794 RepID=A0AA37SN49_9BACT|nr:class I SAM-dependent methyltransferase [Portibacter lacus]GLR17671.1 methyltransferase [Portibacter lacus]
MQVDFWEKRYSEEEFAYGTSPNLFFKEYLKGKVPGKLLLSAEGEGRNAVYAASLGWEVFAFDQSEAGKKKALKLADEHGVKINYEISKLEDFTSLTADFDLIALIYVHVPPAIRPSFHNKLVHLLKPEGRILLEAFNKKQIKNKSGGPKQSELLYNGNMLAYDFQGLDTMSFENATIQLNEGPFHQGSADVIRMIGIAKQQNDDFRMK